MSHTVLSRHRDSFNKYVKIMFLVKVTHCSFKLTIIFIPLHKYSQFSVGLSNKIPIRRVEICDKMWNSSRGLNTFVADTSRAKTMFAVHWLYKDTPQLLLWNTPSETNVEGKRTLPTHWPASSSSSPPPFQLFLCSHLFASLTRSLSPPHLTAPRILTACWVCVSVNMDNPRRRHESEQDRTWTVLIWKRKCKRWQNRHKCVWVWACVRERERQKAS